MAKARAARRAVRQKAFLGRKSKRKIGGVATAFKQAERRIIKRSKRK